jgi:N-acetylmuramoyl-L-alanine amidase
MSDRENDWSSDESDAVEQDGAEDSQASESAAESSDGDVEATDDTEQSDVLDDTRGVFASTQDEPQEPTEEPAEDPITSIEPVTVTPSSGDGTDVIVDGDNEWSIDGVTFKNWRARKTDRRWPGNVMTQDAGWGHPGGPKPIDTIVIHETGAPSGFSRTDCGVHFLVNNDATIYQIGDLKYRYNHASNGVINNKSIGIEFANDTYFAFSRDGERLPIKWRGANKSIRIPSQDQLEAMVTLLDLLMKQYSVDRWLNATIAPGHFLLATNGLPIDPQPSGSRILEPVEVGGLVTHSIIKEHGDGGFIALYAWLRLSGGREPDDAREEAKRIAGADPVDAKTVGRLIKTPNAWAITMMPV